MVERSENGHKRGRAERQRSEPSPEGDRRLRSPYLINLSLQAFGAGGDDLVGLLSGKLLQVIELIGIGPHT